MNIRNYKQTLYPTFKAQTIIEAPEELLSAEEKTELIKQGKRIGIDKDKIEIKISSLKPNKINSNILGFDLSKKVQLRTPNKIVMEYTETTLPYIVEGKTITINEPKKYITSFLDSLANLFN